MRTAYLTSGPYTRLLWLVPTFLRRSPLISLTKLFRCKPVTASISPSNVPFPSRSAVTYLLRILARYFLRSSIVISSSARNSPLR